MRHSTSINAAIAAFLCALAAPAAAQPEYTVTDLGRLAGYTYSTVPLGLNNHGAVVGIAQGGALYQAVIWDSVNGLRALPPVPGQESRSSTALAINDLGEIVGYSGQSGGSHSVGWLYRNGQYTMLGTMPGYDGCIPAAINNNTEIVGAVTGLNPTDPRTNFYWSPATAMVRVIADQVTEFHGINDAGVICGGSRAGSVPPPGILTFDIRTGTPADLGMLPGSELNFGYSINELGQVAGVCIDIGISGFRTPYPIVADPSPLVQDLGIPYATALGINERGEVVGWRPFGSNNSYYTWLYSPQFGLTTDIRTLIADAVPFPYISDARAINDRGQIIATGSNSHFPADSSRRAFILSPVVACAADFTGDNAATVPDIFTFLSLWFASDSAADFDGANGIGVPDIFAFLSAWFAGC